MESIALFLKQFGILTLLGLIGLGLVIYGLWGQLLPPPATVEIIKGSGSQLGEDKIVVDVAGAVERPGIYTLPSGSRIGDAVVLAGGFSARADRSWIAQALNLASELQDSQKVYIPSVEEQRPTRVSGIGRVSVGINTASLSELDSLDGIGAARAQAIIDNRPYSDLHELVTKAKVPQAIFEKIQDQLSFF